MSFSVGTICMQELQFSGVSTLTTAFTDPSETPFGNTSAPSTSFPNLTSIGSGLGGTDLATTIAGWTSSSAVTLATAGSVAHTAPFTIGLGVGGTNVATNEVSVTLVDPVLAGDTIIVCPSFATTNTVSAVFDSSGNPYSLVASGTLAAFESQSLYVAKNCRPTNSLTITIAFNQTIGGGFEMYVMPVHGADTSNPVIFASIDSGNSAGLASSVYSTKYRNTFAASFTQVNSNVSAGQAGYTVGPKTYFGNVSQWTTFSSPQSNITTTATQASPGPWIMSTVVLNAKQIYSRARMQPVGL